MFTSIYDIGKLKRRHVSPWESKKSKQSELFRRYLIMSISELTLNGQKIQFCTRKMSEDNPKRREKANNIVWMDGEEKKQQRHLWKGIR